MRIPYLLRLPLCALLLVLAPSARAQFAAPAASPKAKVTQTVGLTELSVAYSRPGVKGRTIWGGLVPYGEPWRTGANEATRFTNSTDIMVEGQKLAAGDYALVTIPGQDSWVVVFSSQKDMWGAMGYDPKNDVLRVTVKPAAAELTERLSFTFDDPGMDATTLQLRWEKVAVRVRITMDTNAQALVAARAAIAAAKPDDWRTPYRAASWAFDAGLAADEAATWAAAAGKVKENWQTQQLLAKMAAKKGDTATAVTLMRKAIDLGKADPNMAQAVADSEKLLAEWTTKRK
ncbi:MAG: DUF2911 domain-containing protein [bacterium]